MILSVYGAGYVGLVSAVCFAKLGHTVFCADIDQQRIEKLVQGECPIYERELPQLLNEQLRSGRLHFTADIPYAMNQATVHVIATGTPSKSDGSADLSQVFAVVTQLARETKADGIIITKSTVPVGTGAEIETHIQQELLRLDKPYHFDVVSNPEFLREGTAVYDFLHADRIIIGGKPHAIEPLKAIYQPLVIQGIPLLCMSRESAELTKYTANAMLACRISFINQISRIAEKVGANIDEIREGIGLDHRIGPHFLQAGIGYGGSCFPKDGRALAQTAQAIGVDCSLLTAVETINQMQKNWVVEQLTTHFNSQLQNLTIGIWGLSFKPGTDDMREASSLVIIGSLLEAGVTLRLYDPQAMMAARLIVPEDKGITWCNSAEEVCQEQVDALVIATEWPEFKEYSLKILSNLLAAAPLIDGRNCFDLTQIETTTLSSYYSVGRPVYRSIQRTISYAD